MYFGVSESERKQAKNLLKRYGHEGASKLCRYYEDIASSEKKAMKWQRMNEIVDSVAIQNQSS